MASHSHTAHLLIGSNIDPLENVHRALLEICHFGIIRRISRAWQTPAYGSDGPDFINLAVELLTPLPLEAFKADAVAGIEHRLARQRSADKNAPRTIDIDIIRFDGRLLDGSIWVQAHAAITLAELLPDLVNPETQETLQAAAARLAQTPGIIERSDVLKKME